MCSGEVHTMAMARLRTEKREQAQLRRTFLDETGGHGLGECGLDLVVDEEGREHALHFERPPATGLRTPPGGLIARGAPTKKLGPVVTSSKGEDLDGNRDGVPRTLGSQDTVSSAAASNGSSNMANNGNTESSTQRKEMESLTVRC